MIKNTKLITQILEMIKTLIEASEYLYSSFVEKNYISIDSISNDMIEMLNIIKGSILNIKDERYMENICLACESILDSLNRIILFFKSRSPKLLSKIEFELIPLLQDMYLKLYFFGCVYCNKEKLDYYYKYEMIDMSLNSYINEAEKSGKYKYNISIVIVGYNKLEYTKLCVESLLKYVPKDLNYELILVNHGSTDGTKEYFESISPTKQMDILKNGGGLSAFYRIVEGKYVLFVSNDVLVTENAIVNMLSCMESDDKNAWLVPSTPNVSNLQTIHSNYSNIDEMYKFASENNKNDSYRWEKRAKLCNPIDLKRSKIFLSESGIGWGGYFHSTTNMSFPDDKLSLVLRRKGYKMMLAKDAYCYHFGSVTLKDETSKHKDKVGNIGQEAFYNEGRKEFYNTFGIDPWGTGLCWSPALFEYLPCNDIEHVDVLGINCGIGSNPLKVKENIKGNAHNLDVTTYNVTDEKCYIEDLKGVSDVAEYINSCSNIDSIFADKKFKYVIFESKLETYKDPLLIISKLKKRLVEDGIIAIKTLNQGLQNKIKNKYLNSTQSTEWIILK